MTYNPNLECNTTKCNAEMFKSGEYLYKQVYIYQMLWKAQGHQK